MTMFFFPCPWIVRPIVTFDVSQLGLVHTDLELARLIGLAEFITATRLVTQSADDLMQAVAGGGGGQAHFTFHAADLALAAHKGFDEIQLVLGELAKRGAF